MNNVYLRVNVGYEIYLYMHEHQLNVTVPAYDIFNKQCLDLVIERGTYSFSILGNHYTLQTQNPGHYIFETFNRSNISQVAEQIKPNLYYKSSTKIERAQLLQEEYERSISNDIKLTFAYSEKEKILLHEYSKIWSWLDYGSELSSVISIMDWLNSHVKHNGYVVLPRNQTACELLQLSENRFHNQMSCRGLAIIASEMCLSVGLTSRIVFCMQKETEINDCHVVYEVFIQNLNKWVMFDPSYNVYLLDDQGIPLSVWEVRTLLSEEPQRIKFNSGANYLGRKLSQQLYLRSLIRKFYRFIIPKDSYEGCCTRSEMYELVPNTKSYQKENVTLVDNPDIFWRPPYSGRW